MRAAARAFQSLCLILPSLAIAIGAAGFVASPVSRNDVITAEAGIADPDLIKIDQVLAHRAPELGLSLRRRVAEAILEESRRQHYDPMLVLGLIETESAFDGEAISIAGARGLMQLMPVTLEYVIGLEGVRLKPEEIYRDPAMQVRIAIRYLGRLERRFRNLDLALMAYNGGPEKLRVALEEQETDHWFGNYVRSVRMNQARFRRRLPASLAQAERLRLLDGTDMAHMP
jgi:soluble lytic murein transglycosylase-like protein